MAKVENGSKHCIRRGGQLITLLENLNKWTLLPSSFAKKRVNLQVRTKRLLFLVSRSLLQSGIQSDPIGTQMKFRLRKGGEEEGEQSRRRDGIKLWGKGKVMI